MTKPIHPANDSSPTPAVSPAPEARGKSLPLKRLKGRRVSEDPQMCGIALAEARRHLHELQAARIELELQNEELRRAKIELEESRSRYFDLFERAPVGYLTLAASGVVLEANLGATRILGVPRGELVNQPLARFVAPECQELLSRQRASLRPAGVQSCEVRLAGSRDGAPFWVQMQCVAAPDGGHRVILSDSTELSLHRGHHEPPARQGAGELKARSALLEVEVAERKRAEEALLRSEQLYRAVVEDQTELITRQSADGSYLFVNQAYCRFFGTSQEEVAGRSWKTDAFAEDVPQVEQRLRALSAENPVVVVENRVISGTGELRWMQFVSRGFFDERGRLRELQAVGRDITERKIAEEMLLVYAGEIQDLYNHAPCGYHSLDQDGLVTRMNDTELGWLGYQRHEVVGVKKLTDLVSPEGAELFRVQFPRFRKKGHLFDLECQMVRKDGSRFPVIINAEVIRDPQGGYLMSRSTVFDNTERKRAEEQRRRSEDKFRGIFENAPVGIFQTARDGRILSVNPTLAAMFGYASPQQMVREVTDGTTGFLVHPEQREGMLRRVGDNRGFVRDEVLYLRRDGSRFTALLNLREVHGEEGSFLEGFVEDITERKQAEEVLRKYARRLIVLEEDLRKRIAMELHDDVGQMLTALGLNLAHIGNSIQHQAGGGLSGVFEDSRMLTKEISRSVRNLMLDLRPAQLEEYGLAAAVRSHAEQFAQRTGVAVAVEADPFFPRLAAKKEIALFRITQEALNNASKHAAAARVTVALKAGKGTLSLTIADDGEGFVPRQAVPRPAGSGWGLTIMRERAELIGGNLQIESVPGRGTTVAVVIKGRS